MANKLGKAVSKQQKPVPVKIVYDNKAEPVHPKGYDKWQAQDDLRALQLADEIRNDKSRMSQVKKCVTEQMNALKKIK